MESKQEYLVERVSDLLRSRGLRVQHVQQADGRVCADLLCRLRNLELVVDCKAMSLYRASDFRAAIGDAILRFQHKELRARSIKRRLLMAFLLQRIGRKAEADLQEYARIYLPDLQWIILAEDGSGVVHLGEHDERISVPPLEEAARRDHGADRGNLFSPNNQWLFKVLLLSGMDSKYWGGPSRTPDGVSELADISGVPQPSVSAFVSKAEQEGYLKRDSKSFIVQHHQDLLDDWGHALKSRARHAMGLRCLYPSESEEKFLRKLRSYCQKRADGAGLARVAVGGHMGCQLLGLGRSNVRQARLYAESGVKELISALDLVEEPAASAQLLLAVGPNSGPVLRGAVDVDGVRVCDVLQCYFDVRFSYARGREQAEYIYERILQPHFERRY